MVSAQPDISIQEAALLMTEKSVSSLVLMEGNEPAGILTDRDIRTRCVAPGLPLDTPVDKRVFDLVKDFGTSESPKSTRSSTTHWCPGRPGHPAFRHNIASSLRLHTGLPYDWTPRSDAPLGSPLAPSARRVSRVASRLPGTTRLRFALHGGQRQIMTRSIISASTSDSLFDALLIMTQKQVHHLPVFDDRGRLTRADSTR